MNEQRLSLEGVVICTRPRCDHQALFHTDSGCTFCNCGKVGSDFDYSQRLSLWQRFRHALIRRIQDTP